MNTSDSLLLLYVASAFLFQLVLVLHFALRRQRLELAVRLGPVVYALSIPASLASIALLLGGKAWYYWLAGFLYLAWAVYGYTLEYVRKNHAWRDPFQWRVGAPYVGLYLGTVMFYWWPLALISKPLWYAGAFLFLLGALLNMTSHGTQSEKRNALRQPSNLMGKSH